MWSWPVLNDALLDRAGKLQFVGHIDVNQTGAVAELGRALPVSCSRGGFSPAVAEMALGLILNGLRKISDYHAAMRAGAEKWVIAFPKDIDPLERELTGRSVGLIGLGQVGRRLAQLLCPFEPQLNVVDPFVPDAVMAEYQGKRMDIDSMIAASDVVVLCAASNSDTNRLINKDRIEAFRKNALFINVARAALVDYEALTNRLRRGDFFACLDVFDKEPLAVDSELRRLPNAYLTPHRAGGLIRSVQRNLDWLIEDYEAHLAGEPRRYALTKAMIPGLDA